MPKKKEILTPEEQSERFREAVRAAIDAGELNPIEADEQFERLLDAAVAARSAPHKP